MEDILRLYREATGHIYDGETYDMYEAGDDIENESDIEIPVETFGEDSDDGSDSDGERDDVRVEGGGDFRGDGWTEVMSEVVVDDFVEDCGPVHSLDMDCEPYDYFSLILPEDFFELAVRETNNYASYRQEVAGSVDSVWFDTSVGEMKLYFHINIIMGIHQLPSYELYWSSDDNLRVAGVADVMSKNRYEKLSQYFHLNDSRTQLPRGHPDFDPLYKIRPMLDCVKNNIASVFKPNKDISIDEAMVAFHGRLAFKQYVKGKPNPWGIKVWCAADAKTGYLVNFSVYTGKSTNPLPHGLGHHVVTSLGEPYFNKNHHFIFDNFFSSVQLASDLLDNKTYSCSTIRPNRRGWPVDCKPQATKKMKSGDVVYRQNGNMVAMVWKDKRHVTMLSTNTSSGSTSVQRRSSSGRVNVEIPSIVASYNTSMGGVDRFDQLCSYYPVGRKSRKWWRYIFRFLLQVAIINSWILYSNSHCPRPKAQCLSQLLFRLSLSNTLKRGNISRKRKASIAVPSTSGVGAANPLDHRLIRMHGSKRACFWCSKTKNFGSRGRARETVMGCNLCQIRLCKGQCFSDYHDSLRK